MARLILLPGLGGDERMFRKLSGLDVAPLAPRHLVPDQGECLDNYASRVSCWLGINDDDLIGGCSFGGLVASAIARQRPVAGLVLVGSALDSTALGRVGALARFVPPWVLRPFLNSERALEKVFAPESEELRLLAREMLCDAPRPLLLHGARMMFHYRPAKDVLCPVFAIHGARDPVMSPPPVSDCQMVEDAGHGIAWSHGHLVGAFLQKVFNRCLGAPGVTA